MIEITPIRHMQAPRSTSRAEFGGCTVLGDEGAEMITGNCASGRIETEDVNRVTFLQRCDIPPTGACNVLRNCEMARQSSRTRENARSSHGSNAVLSVGLLCCSSTAAVRFGLCVWNALNAAQERQNLVVFVKACNAVGEEAA